jgi:hypothetical protein
MSATNPDGALARSEPVAWVKCRCLDGTSATAPSVGGEHAAPRYRIARCVSGAFVQKLVLTRLAAVPDGANAGAVRLGVLAGNCGSTSPAFHAARWYFVLSW